MTHTDAPALEMGPIGQMMKDGCWDLHQSAENGTVAKGLISGGLSKADYTTLVSQMYLFNKRLDEAVRSHRDAQPSLKALIDDEQLQTPYYEADLKDLGVDAGALEAAPGTAEAIALVDRVENENPADLLALHYVREGANNGNRFVARKLMQVWGQSDLAGMKHLDPYGDSQRAKWETFKTVLNDQPFSDDEKRSLVATGREMFKAVIAIHNDVESGAAK
ncbi:MAG: biliverdin-producing heme oxygenase, partial [Planctomycetota bacterium]